MQESSTGFCMYSGPSAACPLSCAYHSPKRYRRVIVASIVAQTNAKALCYALEVDIAVV